jgi:CRISPR-associated protein Csd1
MFRELVELGRELGDRKDKLPPPGFYYYGEPIRWVVHLWPDRVYLEATELPLPRPFSGRTSDVQAHLLTDEAGYALGVAKDRTGAGDKRSPEKHQAFRELTRKFIASGVLKDLRLKEALEWLEDILKLGLPQQDARYGEVLSKDWVSFVPEVGPLAGHHLFEHPEAKAFWVLEMQERSAPGEKKEKRTIIGECAVCGRQGVLVGKIPLGVKLAGVSPLHSLNADAFTSFQSGSASFKRAHLGLCFECGDTASRAFNYLSNSEQHRRTLFYDKDKRDSLANQIALFWLKAPAPIRVGETTLDLSNLDQLDLGAVLAEVSGKDRPPQATASQLLELLKLPWAPVDSRLRLDEYGFYLGVLSPNVGRVALREWVAVSLTSLKQNLAKFLESTRIVSTWGDPARPLSIGTLLQALETANPNLSRGLLRTAYLGLEPPHGLWTAAVKGFRNPNNLQDPREAWRLQALAGALKLGLFYGEEETMSELNPEYRSKAYLCGRLLAVLEEAQQRASSFSLNKTLVDRFYGAASTAPAASFGGLVRLATTAHLPEVGKEVNLLMEEVMSKLDVAGGFPRTLTLAEQAEFALGFYHQRANFRASRGKNKAQASEGGQS